VIFSWEFLVAFEAMRRAAFMSKNIAVIDDANSHS
jgi:hypothetical protein